MGIGPAAVGIGLYLTVERNYPLYWLLALVVADLLALLGLGMAVSTVELTAATDSMLWLGDSRTS